MGEKEIKEKEKEIKSLIKNNDELKLENENQAEEVKDLNTAKNNVVENLQSIEKSDDSLKLLEKLDNKNEQIRNLEKEIKEKEKEFKSLIKNNDELKLENENQVEEVTDLNTAKNNAVENLQSIEKSDDSLKTLEKLDNKN